MNQSIEEVSKLSEKLDNQPNDSQAAGDGGDELMVRFEKTCEDDKKICELVIIHGNRKLRFFGIDDCLEYIADFYMIRGSQASNGKYNYPAGDVRVTHWCKTFQEPCSKS